MQFLETKVHSDNYGDIRKLTNKYNKPNYELLFMSSVTALQDAYKEYIRLVCENYKLTWVNSNGEFCVYGDLNTRSKNIEVANKEVERLMHEVEKYRKLKEECNE